MWVWAARVIRKAPRRCTSMTESQSLALILKIKLSLMMPALLIKTVTGPSSAAVRCTAVPAALSSATSAPRGIARPPSSMISFAVRALPCSSRSTTPTAIPSAASRRAIAAPMPRAPPVTMATLMERPYVMVGRAAFRPLRGSTTVSPYRHSCPMRWGDMDAQGHINNAAYVDYLQEARVGFLLSGSPALHQLLDSGILVVSHQVEYLRPVPFSDRVLIIDLWVDAIGGSRFSIGYELYDGDKLAARARTGVVPFDLTRNALRRLTAGERNLLSRALAPAEPLRPLPRVDLPGDDHRYSLTVRWSDLDSYGHVNNVKYYDYIQEARISLVNDTVGWEPEAVWMVVRQDLEYLMPIDFRIEPYEVGTAVSAIGNRSFTLAAEIRDPTSSTVYATARTVVVGVSSLSTDQRLALQKWAV